MNDEPTTLHTELQANRIAQLNRALAAAVGSENELCAELNAVCDTHGIEVDDSYAAAIGTRLAELQATTESVNKWSRAVSKSDTIDKQLREVAVDMEEASEWRRLVAAKSDAEDEECTLRLALLESAQKQLATIKITWVDDAWVATGDGIATQAGNLEQLVMMIRDAAQCMGMEVPGGENLATDDITDE